MKSIEFYIENAKNGNSKIWIAQFIDDFLAEKNHQNVYQCIKNKVTGSDKTSILFSAISHQLCLDLKLVVPEWLKIPELLNEPYFLSQLQQSKFLALRDSPYAFRARNIFVPIHYLKRV